MYNQRLAPLSNYTLFNLCYAMRALLLFASKQWNDLTERWTLLGTLHRDSLT